MHRSLRSIIAILVDLEASLKNIENLSAKREVMDKVILTRSRDFTDNFLNMFI